MDTGTEDIIKPIWLSPKVLSHFIDELREAGYGIGISQYIAAQDLVLALTAQGVLLDNPERLRTLLGPILCSSPTEQEDFQYRFDHWVELFRYNDQAAEKTDEKAKALSEELGNVRWRFRQLVLGVIAIILTGIFLPIFVESINNDDRSASSGLNPSPATPSPVTPSPATPSPSPISSSRTNPDLLQDWQTEIGVSLLAMCIAFLVWRFWWLWRAQLFLQRHSTTQQPELHKISIRAFEQNLFSPVLFIQIAQNLRKRIPISSNELDIHKTIDTTLRQGGWLTPVYGFRQVLPEYLFLIDRTSYRDHQAKFVEEMIDRLLQNGVFITVYYFDDDPRVCFSSDGISPPQKLREIAIRYPEHRLIIISDAEKLFDTSTGELEDWVYQTATWSNRAILTPKSVETWGYQELELTRQFVVLPTTPKGLQTLGQVFSQGTATFTLSEENQVPLPEPLRICPYRWIERNPPPSEQIDVVLETLQQFLGRDGFYWFSACAVFPELHWNMTIYLGSVLKTEGNHSLLETCSVINLARLTWFRYGYMPDWLRDCLIKTLTHEQEQSIRTSLQDLLVTAVQGSVGELQLEVAKQHHSLLPRLANSMLYLLSKRASEDSLLRDYIFLSFMTGQPKLAIKMPSGFSRLLYRQKEPRSLSQRRLNRLKLAVLGLIALLGLAIYSGIQVAEYLRLRSYWDVVYSDTETNPVGRDALVRALEAGRSLRRTNLSAADLSAVDLSAVDLSAADLSAANLSNADLSSADLSSADLRLANLSNANLSSANLRLADLSSANLSNANLSNADLSNADLSSIQSWTDAQLSAAKLCQTRLPEGSQLDPDRDCEALGRGGSEGSGGR